jgi:hypothetical protein
MMVLTLTPAVHTYAAIQILIEARNRRIKSQVEVFPTIAELGKGNSIAIKAAGYALICSLHTKDLWPQLKTPRRKRRNRDIVAMYLFRALCEQRGATIIDVPSRDISRECPECGTLGENTPNLFVTCPGCGHTGDQDINAAVILLRRGKAALAK